MDWPKPGRAETGSASGSAEEKRSDDRPEIAGLLRTHRREPGGGIARGRDRGHRSVAGARQSDSGRDSSRVAVASRDLLPRPDAEAAGSRHARPTVRSAQPHSRSEAHTSELPSQTHISY